MAEYVRYEGDSPHDLMAVATYGEVSLGRRSLYEKLREVFDRDVRPNSLHDFLAQSAQVARERSSPGLIVTTNYDGVLEHALANRGETYDVVAYVADGDGAGKFRHYPPDAEPVLITRPSRYDKLGLEERTTILKVHGTFDPTYPERDSYVISENQYIEYLTTDIWDEIPAALIERLQYTHFLFLGYAMRDWNLMVLLKRLHLMPPMSKAWAVQLNQTMYDADRWHERGVDESFDVDLDRYVIALAAKLAELDEV